MQNAELKKRLTDLSSDAQSGLSDLLQFVCLQPRLLQVVQQGVLPQTEEADGERWFMRRSVAGNPYPWEMLTADSKENDRLIREKIDAGDKPVTGLVLAFIGMVEWRKQKQLMAYLQCFRAEYLEGILCLRGLNEIVPGREFEASGSFLIAGSCKNIWI